MHCNDHGISTDISSLDSISKNFIFNRQPLEPAVKIAFLAAMLQTS